MFQPEIIRQMTLAHQQELHAAAARARLARQAGRARDTVSETVRVPARERCCTPVPA
jgi:hypothetical protein